MRNEISENAQKLVVLMRFKNMTLSTAESCTGGLLGACITEIPGVSALYSGGFITYAAEEKNKMLGVSKKLIKAEGTICKKTARQMAEGAAAKTGTDCSLSIVGNAGPANIEGKPVGLVYIGCSIDGVVVVKKYMFEGDRQSIREQAVNEAIKLLLKKLS